MKNKPMHSPEPAWPGSPEEDPLWKLMGHAPLQEPDAWFAARTLARARHQESRRWWVLPRWVWAGGLAVLLLAGISGYTYGQKRAYEMAKNQAAFELLMADNDNEGMEWIGY